MAKHRASAKKTIAAKAKTSPKRGALAAFKHQLSLSHFRNQRPQMWLQAQRLGKLVEIQSQIPDQMFPPGSCFLHANLVTTASFAVKQVREINLETCQVTVDIHADVDLEAGIVILPIEAVEWFGFPSKLVPVGVKFSGFDVLGKPGERIVPKVIGESEKTK